MADKNRTWSCAPFITYDGGDGHGGAPAEVLVTKGVAHVDKIDEGSKSSHVFLRVDGLDNPVSGYINTDDPAFNVVKEAYKNGELVQFRQETQRKRNVDRSKSMNELRGVVDGRANMGTSKENIIRLMVGFGPIGSDLVLSGQHVTDPHQDPNGDAGIAADSAEATKPTFSAADKAAAGDIEARAWLGTNNDGSVNPGSYAITGDINTYFAVRHRFPDADAATLQTTAAELIHVADIMQINVYGGKDGRLRHSNRFYNSHLIARQLLIELVKDDTTEVDLTDSKARHQWIKTIFAQAESIWGWAIREYKSIV